MVISTLAPARDLQTDARPTHASSVPRSDADTHDAIKTTAKQNAVPNAAINDQAKKIDSLKRGSAEKQPDPMRDLVQAILLNIVAAVIFWLIFAYFPEKHRRNKLRPKLELGIYQVYRTLFAMFDSIMRPNAHSPSTFQQKINGNMLRPEDIELGLQNKCLNETFFYDENVSRSLIAAGKGLFEEAGKIDEAIERAFAFSNYLTTREILLLEQIREKLHVYGLEGFDRPAGVRQGDTQYMPVNPSLSYMKDNFAQLYELFGKLQNIVFNNKYEDRDVLLNKVQCYYEQGKFKLCRRSIRIGQARYPTDKTWLDFYLFLCEYMGGNKVVARRKLEDIIKTDSPQLVSSRGFLLDAMNDRSIRQGR